MIPRQILISILVLFCVVIAIALYLLQLRRREVLNPLPVRAVQPVSPPVAGRMEKVTAWVAYDDPGELRPLTISIPLTANSQQRAEELLRGLFNVYLAKGSPHPLGPGAEVLDIYLAGSGLAVIDLNAALVSGHPSGVLVEELTVASMIQTLSANIQGLTRVKILVDGKPHDTLAGHADLSGFYEVDQISELAKELAANAN